MFNSQLVSNDMTKPVWSEAQDSGTMTNQSMISIATLAAPAISGSGWLVKAATTWTRFPTEPPDWGSDMNC